MAKIYHYTRLSTAIEYILPGMCLRTNSLNKMNDPKENQPWIFGGVNIDYEGMYGAGYNDKTHIDCQYRLGREIKNRVQALCFVHDEVHRGFLNEMMWAHYSDNHRGICLELDLEKFIEENRAVLTNYKFENIKYGTQRKFSIRWDRTKTREENLKQIEEAGAENLFFLKSMYWEHENEKRLIVFTGEQKYLKIANSLTGIYLGLFMEHAYHPSMNDLINGKTVKMYDIYYENNQIKKMEREPGSTKSFINRRFQERDGDSRIN